MAKPNVGRSSRSVYKHWVLNAHLGKIAGSLTTGRTPAKANPLLCVDLCAGDGGYLNESLGEYVQSSPAIINKHCEWLARHESGKHRSRSVFIEKNQETYYKLAERLDGLPLHCRHAREHHNIDAATYRISPASEDQAIFINCDPNSVSELPRSVDLVRSLTRTTTVTMTLGCNVGGLKRMTLEQRQPWRDYVELMIDSMPHWHDALLVEICGDASQWAYFTRLPSKWSDEQKAALQRAGDQIKGHFPQGVAVVSLRNDWAAFRNMLRRMLHTQKELASV